VLELEKNFLGIGEGEGTRCKDAIVIIRHLCHVMVFDDDDPNYRCRVRFILSAFFDGN
jgi:hypothetical protein